MSYEFKDNKELKIAVKLWCDRDTHNEALEKYGNISSWNTGNITNMNELFKNTRYSFNDDISSWDTSKVTNMEGMFYNSKFNQNIGSWDVSNVTNMNRMFTGTCIESELIDIDASILFEQSDY